MTSWWLQVVGALGKEAGNLCDPTELVLAFLRLLTAAAAGAVLGIQRQKTGQSAGLRTHMLVSLGAALAIVAALAAGIALEQVARIMQGIAEGVGFVVVGVILMLTKKQEVHGLITAAGL